MLLKDCPVGSVVRLVSIEGIKVTLAHWRNLELEVKWVDDEKFVIDGNGDKRTEGSLDERFQFEIVHPAPTPELRITFTVGGQEFHVGQRVWNLESGGIIKAGDELEILGAMVDEEYRVTVRKVSGSQVCNAVVDLLSTTPPPPHEWKRGDWARHKTRGVVWVSESPTHFGKILVSDDGGWWGHVPESELTFISHAEPPK